jgi:hypothetical protein
MGWRVGITWLALYGVRVETVAMQRRGKQAFTTIEAVFSAWSVPRLDIKAYWLTDRQSQYDFDFNKFMTESLYILYILDIKTQL